jgi:co-chaperonin GroES (HSP10)
MAETEGEKTAQDELLQGTTGSNISRFLFGTWGHENPRCRQHISKRHRFDHVFSCNSSLCYYCLLYINNTQKMTIQALQDCLIVRPDMEKHELFILLREKQTGTGVVISAGPDAKDVKVGDKVLFGDSIGQDLKWEGDNLLVMRESHTLGVFDA